MLALKIRQFCDPAPLCRRPWRSYAGVPMLASLRTEFPASGEWCISVGLSYDADVRDGEEDVVPYSAFANLINDCEQRVTFLLVAADGGFLLQAAESRGEALGTTTGWCASLQLRIFKYSFWIVAPTKTLDNPTCCEVPASASVGRWA